jgi:lipopolysaccharide/colanic/teichoic acid biosynthesis glycosyltransferase
MSQKGAEYIQGGTKRGLDLVGGLLIAAVLTPAAVPIAAEVMVEQRSWNPIFKQKRVGRPAASIIVRKFETIRDKEAGGELHGGFNHPGASVAATAIRRSGLDEIPQLASVIKGDMGLAGIRPIPQNYLDYYESFTPPSLFSEWYNWYQINPGLTGAGQLYARNFSSHTPESVRSQMSLEIKACENASFWNDLKIIMATPPILLGTALGFKMGPESPAPELDAPLEVVTMESINNL